MDSSANLDSSAFGCEISVGGRKIVYSGDTGWTDDLIAQTQNADLFICECSYFETRLATHLDYLQIEENLERFGSKRIVLTHLGQEVLRRSRRIDLEMAYDGLIVVL
jgi:ribonuclease BN (tRNA processing enzyme)